MTLLLIILLQTQETLQSLSGTTITGDNVLFTSGIGHHLIVDSGVFTDLSGETITSEVINAGL